MHSMMKNRAWRDIIADILQSSLEGNSKTKIMKEAGLSYLQLEKYLAGNQKLGLMNFIKENKTYVTTEKGREFLSVYNILNEFTKFEQVKEMENRSILNKS